MSDNDLYKHSRDKYYATALDELKNKLPDKVAWSKALSESGGDGEKAEALYIKIRVHDLAENDTIDAALTSHIRELARPASSRKVDSPLYKYCTFCAGKLPLDAGYCSHCGAELPLHKSKRLREMKSSTDIPEHPSYVTVKEFSRKTKMPEFIVKTKIQGGVFTGCKYGGVWYVDPRSTGESQFAYPNDATIVSSASQDLKNMEADSQSREKASSSKTTGKGAGRDSNHAANKEHSTPQLPMNWFKFYVYVRIPLGILFNLPFAFPHIGDIHFVEPLGILLIAVLIALLVGLHRRTIWGWNLNLWILGAEVILVPLGTTHAQGHIINALPFMVVMFGIWWLPNYLYFNKRKQLFT